MDLHNLSPTLSIPEAAQLLGIGRNAAYQAAAAGQLPTLRIGRRLLVPTARLRALLGLEPQPAPVGATAEGAR